MCCVDMIPCWLSKMQSLVFINIRVGAVKIWNHKSLCTLGLANKNHILASFVTFSNSDFELQASLYVDLIAEILQVLAFKNWFPRDEEDEAVNLKDSNRFSTIIRQIFVSETLILCLDRISIEITSLWISIILKMKRLFKLIILINYLVNCQFGKLYIFKVFFYF